MDDAKMKQVADQCRAVRHMAEALAKLHDDYAIMFDSGAAENLVDQVGKRTAGLMETLGDILNGMDAVTEEDDWITPIMHEAQRRWPGALAA